MYTEAGHPFGPQAVLAGGEADNRPTSGSPAGPLGRREPDAQPRTGFLVSTFARVNWAQTAGGPSPGGVRSGQGASSPPPEAVPPLRASDAQAYAREAFARRAAHARRAAQARGCRTATAIGRAGLDGAATRCARPRGHGRRARPRGHGPNAGRQCAPELWREGRAARFSAHAPRPRPPGTSASGLAPPSRCRTRPRLSRLTDRDQRP
jgi:hypothetical protein